MHIVRSPEEGVDVLGALALPTPQLTTSSRSPKKPKIAEEWNTAGHTSWMAHRSTTDLMPRDCVLKDLDILLLCLISLVNLFSDPRVYAVVPPHC